MYQFEWWWHEACGSAEEWLVSSPPLCCSEAPGSTDQHGWTSEDWRRFTLIKALRQENMVPAGLQTDRRTWAEELGRQVKVRVCSMWRKTETGFLSTLIQWRKRSKSLMRERQWICYYGMARELHSLHCTVHRSVAQWLELKLQPQFKLM